MDIGFTEDQVQFRAVVQRFLTDKSPTAEVRKQMATAQGFDAAVWHQLCGELGLAGTHLPEAYGGFGFGPVELSIVAEEMGRSLFCGPFFASAVMAATAILNCGSESQKQALLPSIADGTMIAALVLDDLNTVDGVGRSIEASGTDSEVLLNGAAAMVVDAHIANKLVVAARSVAGISFYLVDVDAPGVSISALEVLDPTRKLSSVTLSEVTAELLGEAGGAQISRLWDQLSTVLANEMVGGATHLFETTIDYMKMRVQFGRTIGSFQALKHRTADLLMELEFARAAAHDAARAEATGSGEPYAANMAKALASDAYMSVARAAIQLRGGIGFTWEEDTHLWFKRAKSSEVFLGTPVWHRETMIQKMEAAHV
ncbi:MAG: acyl-CoA dehydrogenase family protein [Pseudomonadales bacterium]